MARIEKINLPNTKIKALQRLLAYAIEEFQRVNKIKSIEFAERMKAVVDIYITIDERMRPLLMRSLMMLPISLQISSMN
nr:type I restriction enzyme endonuclease domain-containing protein [uncultured Butyrivibrio sp.]